MANSKDFIIKNGASVCDDVLLSVNPELTEYTNPANVKIISCDAFKNSKIKEIDIPNGVSKLDICAFSYSELERISLKWLALMLSQIVQI